MGLSPFDRLPTTFSPVQRPSINVLEAQIAVEVLCGSFCLLPLLSSPFEDLSQFPECQPTATMPRL